MEDDLNNLCKWKTTSIYFLMEDNLQFQLEDNLKIVKNLRRLLNLFENGRQLKFFSNKRQPQLFCKWKTSSIYKYFC